MTEDTKQTANSPSPEPIGSALPSVAGRMEMTHADFQRACRVELARLQEDHLCDTRIIHLLCEAVRCSRECCGLAKMSLRVPNARGELPPAPDSRKPEAL